MGAVLQARITAFTHEGGVRDHNEDTIALGTWVRNAPMEAPRQIAHWLDRPLVCLVADGMGGHVAGEEASRLVAFRLAERADEVANEDGISTLLSQVNRELFEAMQTDARRVGMGTTVAGLLLRPDGMIWFNVGDSRIYRYRDGFLRQLSIDDVPDFGADRRLRSHSITQALGGGRTFAEVAPHAGTEPVVGGWRYLLCSDGLTDEVDLDDIEAAFSEDDEGTVRELFERAMAAGGSDNISIVLVRIEEARGNTNAEAGRRL